MHFTLNLLIYFLFISSFAEGSELFSYQGAVMGYGNMGRVHASYFSDLCKKPVHIIEIEESKIQLALEKGYLVFPTLDALLETEKIDFLAICTPTYLHLAHIKEGLKQKLPIFVEKPIVKNSAEVEEIKTYASPFIFVGEVEQYNPLLQFALDGQSPPTSISIQRNVNLEFFIGKNQPWFLNSELSGGIVTDLMIHDLTLLIEKFGKPQVKKVNYSQNIYPCIDEVSVQLEFQNFKAYLQAHWCSQNKETPILLIFEVAFMDEKKQIICSDYLKEASTKNDPYFIQDRAFLSNLKEGKTCYPLEIYLQAVDVADEINNHLKSSKSFK